MKKILTLLLASSFLNSFAQSPPPPIDGTYLPVRGTAVKQVWDTLAGTIPLPASGANMEWNYYGYFTDASNTYKIKTFPADTTPYFNHFNTSPDSATHASYLYSPLNNSSDSLYSYYVVDREEGLYMLGGRSDRARPQFSGSSPQYYVGNDTTFIITNKNPMKHGELYAPINISYNSADIFDTTRMITHGHAYSGSPFFVTVPITVKEWNYKKFEAIGYGKLIMPDSTIYNDALLARVEVKYVDSLFNGTDGTFVSNTTLSQLGLSGVIQNPQTRTLYQYAFIRHNTFGSAYLMYFLGSDTLNLQTSFINGWYSIPVDFGYIAGTVYTDISESTPVTQGEILLYRENSNFAKDDILARTNLDPNGNYKFNNIPFGEYRISVRPDLDDYPNAFTTYWGDVTDWLTAPTVNTINPNDSSSDDNNIHLRYHPAPQGQGEISGNLNLDGDVRGSDPIPGVDIIVKKNPGGAAFRETQTDMQGDYSLANLDDGDYTLFVDIPGLHVKTTYDFEIVGGTVIGCLDFTSGTDSIHADYSAPPPACSSTSIKGKALQKFNSMQAYPNPYTTYTTIKVDIAQKSDVLLEVYNVLGEKITTLDKGVKQAGQYSYNFNAKSLNHASGLYFVKLLVNNKIDVLRIVEQ